MAMGFVLGFSEVVVASNMPSQATYSTNLILPSEKWNQELTFESLTFSVYKSEFFWKEILT